MKKEQLRLSTMQKILSRDEMKKVMGGDTGDSDFGDDACVKSGKLCNHNDKCCSGNKCPSQEAAKCP